MAVQGKTAQQVYDSVILVVTPKSKPADPLASAESYIKQLLVEEKESGGLWPAVLENLQMQLPTQDPFFIDDADQANAYLAQLDFIVPTWQELGLPDNAVGPYWRRLQKYIRLADKYPSLGFVPYRRLREVGEARAALVTAKQTTASNDDFDLDDFDFIEPSFSSEGGEAVPIPDREMDSLADLFADLDDEPGFLSNWETNGGQGGGIAQEELPIILKDTAPMEARATKILNVVAPPGKPISKKWLVLFAVAISIMAGFGALLGLTRVSTQSEQVLPTLTLEPTQVPALVPTASLPPEPTVQSSTADPYAGMSPEEIEFEKTQQALQTAAPK